MNHSSAQATSPTSRLGHSAASSSSSSDLWSEILRSADRGNRGSSYGRKNILLLSERNRGRRYFLDQLTASSSTTAKRRNVKKTSGDKARQTLAMGYELLEVKEDGDEDSVPPVSIFYPPSSHHSMLRLLPKSLPPNSLPDTSVVILLDWTKPYSMMRELINWLVWVQSWASSALQPGQADEFRERLQSHIQHYSEPQAPTPGSSTSANPPLASMSTTYDTGPLLPLGQGTLTLNECGIPITIVCTRADLMDATGDELGMKGGGWEERTDWIQQVLRTISLAYGAALFYTAPTQPQTYSLVRSYLLHRLYTVPPPLHPQTKAESSTSSYPQAGPSSSKFPFSHRANVLDRDAVMVPTGWDSYGKINVLRDRFDPPRVAKALGVSLERAKRIEGEQGDLEGDDEGEGVEDMWREMIPDMESSPQAVNSQHVATTSEPEQTFLSRQLDILVKDPNRDPRASFRTASAALGAASNATTSSSNINALMGSPDAGIVGPMGAGGLSLPGVEKAMMDMEGGSVEDMKEKFARLGRRDPTKGGPLSPTGVDASTGKPASSVPNEALHNFFQGLLATKGKSSTPSKSTATSPSAPARTPKEA